jgi:hypothetical protein
MKLGPGHEGKKFKIDNGKIEKKKLGCEENTFSEQMGLISLNFFFNKCFQN